MSTNSINQKKPVWALGLMSGTSLDGIDAALIKTDGVRVTEQGAWLMHEYSAAEKTRLREAVRERGDMPALERDLTLLHADAVRALLKKANVSASDISVIGFHGQTVAHRPHEGVTWQIGDGALLAEQTGIDVVCDFRRRDVAAGGQGAPLVPLYHAALAKDLELPVAVLNIGGSANVTWVGGEENLLAFDTGPGNVLINDWVHSHTGADHDEDGKLARAGSCNEAVLAALMTDSYFSKMPPKSLDRNHFSLEPVRGLSVEDGAATLTELTAAAVELAQKHFPQPAKRWLVCGGGRHNPALMAALAKKLKNVEAVEALGWQGDALEAQAFAFLAVRSVLGLPLSLPTTTGARQPTTGGIFFVATQ
ncbi:MAG: anhydro-N-acetylmuramic acid kinase [Alphaproteobacteria bacterium]|nr:anhydro-N-acetylmuramic acid kinase [Alphaproteobacteria bacterium]